SHSLSVSSCSAQVRPPPESTFFPYTTLFRSGCQGIELGEEGLRIEHDAVADDAHGALDDPRRNLVQHELAGPGVDGVAGVGAPRSEEHTSELQSRFDLVCRLLLEKKN